MASYSGLFVFNFIVALALNILYNQWNAGEIGPSSTFPARRSYFRKLPEQIKANMLTITVSITLSISIDDTHSQPLSARQQKPSRRASPSDFFGSLTNLIKGKLGLKEALQIATPTGKWSQNEVCLMVRANRVRLKRELWLRMQSLLQSTATQKEERSIRDFGIKIISFYVMHIGWQSSAFQEHTTTASFCVTVARNMRGWKAPG